jgi:hypothetical protein
MSPATSARLRRLALALVGTAALVAWVAAAPPMLLAFLLLWAGGGPDPLVLGLELAMALGWFAAGVWLIRELFRGRWRLVLAPVVAWAWVYLLAQLLVRSGHVNFGY